MFELVLATKNKGKVAELKSYLSEFPVTILTTEVFPQIGEIEETGNSFEENAKIKAEHVAGVTGKLALADDSGLEVDELNGQPGIYSARYAGEQADDQKNNEKLLAELAGVPYEKRTARFECAIAISHPDISTRVFVGSCEGYIIETIRGESGFGYDPLFYYPPLDKTFAEMTKEEKSSVSHRGKALSELVTNFKEIIISMEGE